MSDEDTPVNSLLKPKLNWTGSLKDVHILALQVRTLTVEVSFFLEVENRLETQCTISSLPALFCLYWGHPDK